MTNTPQIVFLAHKRAPRKTKADLKQELNELADALLDLRFDVEEKMKQIDEKVKQAVIICHKINSAI